MSSKRKHPVSTGDPTAVVTYSRLRARTPAEPREFDPVEPHFSATEIPLVDAPEPVDGAAPEIRSPLDGPDEVAAAAEIYDGPRRRRSTRLVTVAALVAIVLAIGVLAVTFGPAALDGTGAPQATADSASEIVTLEKRIEELAADPGASPGDTEEKIAALKARLAELEQGKAGAVSAPEEPAPAVREIPLTGAQPATSAEEPPAPATTAMVPPAPRIRPERSPAAEPGQPAPDAGVASAPGNDDFISEIERTLSGVDATAAPPVAAPPPAAEAAPAPGAPSDAGAADTLNEDAFVEGIERALAP